MHTVLQLASFTYSILDIFACPQQIYLILFNSTPYSIINYIIFNFLFLINVHLGYFQFCCYKTALGNAYVFFREHTHACLQTYL